MAIKPIIYQMLPRLFANYCDSPVRGGTIHQNGSGKLNDITSHVLDEIHRMGITHVWYTGIIEHAHDADYTRYGIKRNNPHVVKGRAGSPYAITDYYDVDPDLAVDVNNRMEEFDDLVKRTHAAGMKVIIDFVPNHVAREYHSDASPRGVEDFGCGDDREMFFSPFNNFYYIPRQQFSPHVNMGSGSDAYVEFPAKASGNDCFTAFPGENDWYDTVKLNYGVDYWNGSKHFDPIPPTWFKMLEILHFWASRGVDGFRCDMVHMVPLEFWHWAIPGVKSHNPDIVFIAEIYDVSLYRPYIHDGGFDYLYDKVNLYDTLRGIDCDNVSAACITSCWQTVEGIAPNMLNFLENHDEQRYASVFYAGNASHVIAPLVVSSMISTGPMMIYAGQELGEPASGSEGYSGNDGRTTIFDYWSIPTLRGWLNHGSCDGALSRSQDALRKKYVSILTLCNSVKAIREGGFFDLMYVNYDNPGINPHRQYAFLRSSSDETLFIAVNFDDEQHSLSIIVPRHAFDTLGIPEGERMATELLSGKRAMKRMARDSAFETVVGAHDAVVWMLPHENIRTPDKKVSDKVSLKIKKL